MSGARFTPGPWSVGHMTNPDHPCECRTIFSETCAGGVATISKNNGLDIRDGGNDAPPEPEAIANAHLIAAAAPDLVAALEGFNIRARALVRSLEGAIPAPIQMIEAGVRELKLAMAEADAALAKADGER
jgi:hypothetical protein